MLFYCPKYVTHCISCPFKIVLLGSFLKDQSSSKSETHVRNVQLDHKAQVGPEGTLYQ